MNGFYICIIFIGIILIGISIVLIVIDKKNTKNYLKKIESKHEQLESIIVDAEQMVLELNKFSDYVVEKIEISKAELQNELKKIENIVHRPNDDIDYKEIYNIKPMQNFKKINITKKENIINEDIKNEDIEKDEQSVNTNTSSNVNINIATTTRHSEVLELIEKGYSHAEISKILKIGRGEIQLITGLKKTSY